MKIIYFDCFAGASGDMLLAALLDAGAPLEAVKQELACLPLSGYELKLKRVLKKGISALDLTVAITEEQLTHRHYHQIATMLNASALSPQVKAMSLTIFNRLAEAEGKIHGKAAADVHFHEVGAVDSIVDIVGIAAALNSLGADKIYSSPLHCGSGFVRCAHGELPVPAPATLELLSGVPVYSRGIEAELLTPTGAAVLSALAEFGPLPSMTVSKSGYGAGKKELSIANLLRVIIGETAAPATDYLREETVILEANIDDMNPEFYSYISEKLFTAGALDVTLIPVQMKKGRPGVMLSVLAGQRQEKPLLEIIFSETTTLGIRRLTAEKLMLPRRLVSVQTAYGPVRVKIAEANNRIINAAPEYQDCRQLAEASGAPLKKIYSAAMAAAFSDRLLP
ncbi:MAG: nickel pincer cofactor biosynthesis protein LarC [Clostridium sp.]|nr:nickel pincer cofactor biosynthesis protein LarC [Clostridium sp.]